MITVDKPNEFGCFSVREQDGDNPPHRRVIEPGRIEAGEYIPTDVSGEDTIIQSAAAAAWTGPVVAAWRALLEQKAAKAAESEAAALALRNGEGVQKRRIESLMKGTTEDKLEAILLELGSLKRRIGAEA